MRKLFAFGLILIACILFQSFTHPDPGPIGNDNVITLNINQAQTNIPVIASFATIGESDYSCTQELLRIDSFDGNYKIESNYGICRVDNYKVYRQISLSSTDNTTIELIGNIPANKLRGVTRLDIGENCYRQNTAHLS